MDDRVREGPVCVSGEGQSMENQSDGKSWCYKDIVVFWSEIVGI